MSSFLPLVPRTVKIVAAKTRRWRVIFLGGEKKQATGIIDAQDGYPRWDCEVQITTPKPVDSVSMLVIDGKERHVGQVIIPLAEIADVKTAPVLITANLRVVDLQPTKHNSTPCGQLSFWVWVVDFWPEGTIAGGSRSLSTSRSFKGSISQIGSALKSHSSHDGADHASRLGKLRNLKHRDKRSALGSAVGNGGASVISGYSLGDDLSANGVNEYGGRNESIISSHAMGWSSEIGAGSSMISSRADGTASQQQQQSRPSTVAASYNPLASPEEFQGNSRGSAKFASSWTLGTVEDSGLYAAAPSGDVLPPKPIFSSVAAVGGSRGYIILFRLSPVPLCHFLILELPAYLRRAL
ncbi:unnamed protein product [Schistocephalus solidus]|uniref:C2 domain-containing protein n=1 Tax=Schistocephalus solidus TaxID=70667 RepID=A0A183TIL4_SCHSO|nr:unnamed protein product [Schistocephalus solidus]